MCLQLVSTPLYSPGQYISIQYIGCHGIQPGGISRPKCKFNSDEMSLKMRKYATLLTVITLIMIMSTITVMNQDNSWKSNQKAALYKVHRGGEEMKDGRFENLQTLSNIYKVPVCYPIVRKDYENIAKNQIVITDKIVTTDKIDTMMEGTENEEEVDSEGVVVAAISRLELLVDHPDLAPDLEQWGELGQCSTTSELQPMESTLSYQMS